MKGRRGQEQWRHGDVGGEPWVLGGSTIEEIRGSRYFFMLGLEVVVGQSLAARMDAIPLEGLVLNIPQEG